MSFIHEHQEVLWLPERHLALRLRQGRQVVDTYRAYRIRVFGLTLVFYYDTVARGSTGIGAVLDLYRGQMRAFVAGFHLYLLQRRVGIELRRRYW